MTLTELHLLLTYECNRSCAHCFVWGAPTQSGTMTGAMLRRVLDQAKELGSIEWIYLEGGEPFLHYGLLLDAARLAAAGGFRVGLVTNAFWAAGARQARERLLPLAGLVQDLSISTDGFHGDAEAARQAACAFAEAEKLGIPVNRIRVAPPGEAPGRGQSEVVFRGRAAERLAGEMPPRPAGEFDRCPHENLRDPGRVHIDPLGWVHICQGITLGNCLERTLAEIFTSIDVEEHPVIGPLLRGGPAGLALAHGVDAGGGYADACHLCYTTRTRLRPRFPRELGPAQMYGAPGLLGG